MALPPIGMAFTCHTCHTGEPSGFFKLFRNKLKYAYPHEASTVAM